MIDSAYRDEHLPRLPLDAYQVRSSLPLLSGEASWRQFVVVYYSHTVHVAQFPNCLNRAALPLVRGDYCTPGGMSTRPNTTVYPIVPQMPRTRHKGFMKNDHSEKSHRSGREDRHWQIPIPLTLCQRLQSEHENAFIQASWGDHPTAGVRRSCLWHTAGRFPAANLQSGAARRIAQRTAALRQ